MEQARATPANVVLELSELAPVLSYERLRRVVEQWRERGVRLAIDDVGAGHANRQHVLELSPDVIKLDRALIQDVAVRPDKQALIRGIVKFTRTRVVPWSRRASRTRSAPRR